MDTILYIMFLHFLGDFVFQTDKMAQGKAHSLKWLLFHILTYGSILLIGLGTHSYYSIMYFPEVLSGILAYVASNVGLHMLIDFFTSKITSYYWAKKKTHEFFVVIGLDQFLHFLCLYLTLGVLK